MLFTDCLFFSFPRLLLNTSYIILIHAFILFPRSQIFTVIILNSFSGRLPISSSLIWSCEFLPCSFICNTFLCHLIQYNLLRLWSPSCRLRGCISPCLYCLVPVCEGVPGACVGFLVGSGAQSFSSAVQGHIRWCALRCQGVQYDCMGSLSFDGWGCVSVLLIIWHKVFTVDLQAVGLSWVLVSIWIPLERTY